MAKLVGFKIPQQAMTGFLAGVFSSLLVWLVSLIKPIGDALLGVIQNGGRNALISGTGIGDELVLLLTGRLGIGEFLPSILIAGLGGAALVMLGTWIYNMKWSPDAIPGFKQTPLAKMTLVLFYASIFATLLLSAFALPTIATVLVLFVNSIVTAWFVTELLGKQLQIV